MLQGALLQVQKLLAVCSVLTFQVISSVQRQTRTAFQMTPRVGVQMAVNPY